MKVLALFMALAIMPLGAQAQWNYHDHNVVVGDSTSTPAASLAISNTNQLSTRLGEKLPKASVIDSLLNYKITPTKIYPDSARIGSATTAFSFFDSKGRYYAVGDSALAWGEVVVNPIGVTRGANTKPDFGAAVFPWHTYSFDAAAAESLFFSFEVPHDMKMGTKMDAHIHWAPSTTNTSKCAWKLAYAVAKIDTVIAFAAGDTLSAQQAGSGTAHQHQYCDLGDLKTDGLFTVSGFVAGCLIRDADLNSDTFTGEAELVNIGFHYRKDSMGSRWELKK